MTDTRQARLRRAMRRPLAMTANLPGKAASWRLLIAIAAAMIVGALAILAVGGPATRATFPAQNGRIAFQVEKRSGTAIYTIKPNGTGLRRLTPVNGEALDPDWSPDGSRIAFALNECRVAIMNADGSGRTVLPSETPGGCEAGPSFTPDGSRLVYERYDPPKDDAVWSMNLDGTDRRRITAPDVGGGDPNVSPDGETLSFLGGTAKVTALFTASLDGSNVLRVTPNPDIAYKHDWAPDGRHIVIATNANYPNHKSPNVATIRPDGSHVRMLTHYTGGEKGALAGSYSPDGRWIVFRVENVERESFRLFKMHPDGTHRKLIRKFPFASRNSDWGPRP
jgi:Tol biopolymer transport system component